MAICDAGARWSRGKWWLWTILGLLALYLLMLWSKWDNIEKDIQARTNTALSDAGHAWASADLDYRGRDVMLSGVAPSEAAQQSAVEVARGVEGVRVVGTQFDLQEYRAPSFALSSEGQGEAAKVVLRGEMPTQDAVDQAVSAASAVYGADRVNNQLTLASDISEPSWMGALPSALSGMKAVSNPGLSIASKGVTLEGVVRSDDEKVSAYNMVNAALGGNVDNQLSVKPFIPSSLQVARDAKGITLQGMVDSKPTVDGLVRAAANVVGADQVTNQLKISADVSKPAWAGALGGALGDIPVPGQLDLDAGKVTVSGEMPDAASKTSLLSRVSNLFSGQTVVDKLSVKPAPKPKPVVVEATKPKQPGAAEICQQRLNDAMVGKKIKFATSSAEIGAESFPLLGSIIDVVKDCNAQLTGSTIEVSGHTDSTGALAYNEHLSTERANAVLRYLVNAGVNGERLNAVGYGPHRPVATNDTREGRAQNRRIQFEIKQ